MKNFQCKITAVVGFCSGLALLTFVYSPVPADPPKIVLDSCPQDLTFAFAKTHKTGSSTLKEILDSFKERKENESSNYRKQIQEFPRPFVGGYPGSFRRDLAFVEESSSDDAKVLKPLVGWNGTQTADFLISHLRFNVEVMNPKAKYFTILREPKRQFESSFHYYYGRYSTGLKRQKPATCHWFPYLQITQKFGTSFSEYLTLIERNLNETIPWFFRSMNPQSYDLGLDPLNLESDYVIKKAKEIDAKFDLVLILEHLPESLVLLKDLMCMDWTDIIPSRDKNEGTYVPLNFSDDEAKIINHFTKQVCCRIN